MNSMNFDENTIHKLQEMMRKGELNDIISQIPPDMIKGFSSKMFQDNSNNQKNQSSHNSSEKHNISNNFDFSKIDMNTILKMKSIMEKMNNSNNPGSNLLYSLKPYLRKERKEKIDQYANLLNFAQIANILKDNDKENSDNA